MAIKERNFNYVIGAVDAYSKALEKAERDFNSFGNRVARGLKTSFRKLPISIKNIFNRIENIAKKTSIAVVASFSAMLIAGLKFNTDLNEAMARVATLMPGQIKRIRALKKEVQKLAIATGKGTVDIATGLFEVISAFGDTAETVDKLTIAVRTARASSSETIEVVKLLSGITKGFGDTSVEATKKAANLALVTARLGQTTFPELANSLGKVIPLASKLNVTQEEMFTIFATLTGVTGNTSEASTQLSSIFRGLIDPTSRMKEIMKELGFSTGETLIKQKGLVGALKGLTEKTDGTSNSISELFGRSEALVSTFALIGESAGVFDEKLVEVKNSSDEVKKAFKEQTEGINKLGAMWTALKTKVSTALEKVGEILTPFAEVILKGASEKITEFLTILDKPNIPANKFVKDTILFITDGLLELIKTIRFFEKSWISLKSLFFSDFGKKHMERIDKINKKYKDLIVSVGLFKRKIEDIPPPPPPPQSFPPLKHIDLDELEKKQLELAKQRDAIEEARLKKGTATGDLVEDEKDFTKLNNLNIFDLAEEQLINKKKKREEELTKATKKNQMLRKRFAMNEMASEIQKSKTYQVAEKTLSVALLKSLETGKRASVSFSRIVIQQAKAELTAIAARAAIRAIFETALGLGSLAIRDKKGADLHFGSAANFGIAAAQAAGGALAVQAIAGNAPSRSQENNTDDRFKNNGLENDSFNNIDSELNATSTQTLEAKPTVNLTVRIDGMISPDNLEEVVQNNIIPVIEKAGDRDIKVNANFLES